MQPMLEDPNDLMAMELWKLDLKEYRDKRKTRQANDGKVFSLILGQCSGIVRDRLRSEVSWDAINNRSDPISLLTLICQAMFTQTSTGQSTHTYVVAEIALARFKQGDRMTLHDYFERLKGLIEVYEHVGGEPGVSRARVVQYLNNPADEDDPNLCEQAKADAQKEYIAMSLSLKSDPRRYGGLIADLMNDYTRGIDGYPTTAAMVYDMLSNYRSA